MKNASWSLSCFASQKCRRRPLVQQIWRWKHLPSMNVWSFILLHFVEPKNTQRKWIHCMLRLSQPAQPQPRPWIPLSVAQLACGRTWCPFPFGPTGHQPIPIGIQHSQVSHRGILKRKVHDSFFWKVHTNSLNSFYSNSFYSKSFQCFSLENPTKSQVPEPRLKLPNSLGPRPVPSGLPEGCDRERYGVVRVLAVWLWTSWDSRWNRKMPI